MEQKKSDQEEPSIDNKKDLPIQSSPQNIAQEVFERVLTGKKILAESEKLILQALTVDGKNLKQWAKELTVKIPEGDVIEDLERASAQVANAIQKAEYILAVFELQSSMAANFHEESFAKKYVVQMEGRRERKLAAEKLRQLTLIDPTVDGSLAASQTAKMVADYFKRIVKGLEEVRKGIENRARLIGLRISLNRS